MPAGVSMLAKQVIRAGSRRQKGDAILKLYAVISQAAWVTQRGLTEEWTAIYFGLLQIGLARFIKHAAGIVVRPDKGFNDLVGALPRPSAEQACKMSHARLCGCLALLQGLTQRRIMRALLIKCSDTAQQ